MAANSPISAQAPAPVFGPGARVPVLLPTGGPEGGFYDYRVPPGLTLRPGDVVEVPLGRRRLEGVVWDRGPEGRPPVAEARLRDVAARLDAPPMGGAMRRFVEWVAAYTVSEPGLVLKMTLSVPEALHPELPSTILALGPDADEKVAAIRITPERARVIEVARATPPVAAARLAEAASVSVPVVQGLLKAGVLVSVTAARKAETEPHPASARAPVLSESQARAANALRRAVAGRTFAVFMLDGVTGSGKTEVYFEAIAAALDEARQVLVLLPEIALGSQWLARFEDRFGFAPDVWHSELTPATRRKTWRRVAEGRARLVVGARSSLFLPFCDLGLVVVDEEHDGAFKQEDGVVYHARDMGVVRARLEGVPCVLSSATPSLETLVNAETGKYTTLHLAERHGEAVMPSVSLIDIRKEAVGSRAWISDTLAEAVRGTLAAGEQAMLFLNRRGYAPLTLCRRCGHRINCPNCTAWLVEHRRRGQLLCHHCGHTVAKPDTCPECGAEDTLAVSGPGVERLAEEAAEAFPEARIAIAASDTLSGPKAAAELVRRIEAGEVNLLVGTQIVAKGYHFPLLTLVGVVDADIGLAGGDLRAAERTFQLLHQVSGRAGRADRPGRVLIQTAIPEHPVMAALAAGDRDAFFAAEKAARAEAAMPPFGRLVALVVSGKNEAEVEGVARALGRAAPADAGLRVLGPAPAPFALLRGRHRRRLLLKAPPQGAGAVALQGAVRAWLARVKPPRGVRVQVDVDPVSFF